jgi:hypothetical protein
MESVMTMNKSLTVEKFELSSTVHQLQKEKRNLQYDNDQQREEMIVSKLDYQAFKQQNMVMSGTLKKRISDSCAERNKLLQERQRFETLLDENQLTMTHLQSENKNMKTTLVNTQQQVERLNHGQEQMSNRFLDQMKYSF